MPNAELTADASVALALRATDDGGPVITSGSGLRALLARGPRATTALLQLDGMDPAEARSVTTRLNALAQECGCNAGSIGMVLGGGLVAVAAFVMSIGLLAAVPLIIVAILLAGFLGKRTGISFAHWRWRREIEALIDRWYVDPRRLS